MKKKSNPLIWGVWGAVISTVVIFVARTFGEGDVPYSIYAAAVIGYFWGWLIAVVKNWIGKRMGLPFD